MPIAMLLARALPALGVILFELGMLSALLYELIWKRRDDPRRVYQALRCLGPLLLAAALGLCAGRWGWDMGAAIWVGFLAAGTLLVAFVLPPLSRLVLSVTPQALVFGFSVVLRLLT